MKRFRRTIASSALGILCLASPLLAQKSQPPSQASIDPSRLPGNTVFYLLWRGAPAPAVRSANSLFALWDDAGFEPARNALLESFLGHAEKSPEGKSPLTREEVSEYATLLENPISLGFVGEPRKTSSDSLSPKANDAAHKWNGFFLIYDRTGKEALLEKALLRMRALEKRPPKRTPIMIAGIPALKVEHTTDTDYLVETGKYLINCGEISITEELLAHLKSETMPATSLAAVPAFQEAGPVLGDGIFEFFINLSDAIRLAGDAPGPQGIRPSTILDSIRMSAVHSVSGRVYLDGAKTRFQAGILGDAAPGTVFDIWDRGQEKPASIAYITPNAVSYREAQLNLPGVYALAMRIARPFLPKSPDEKTDMMEMAAQMKLGMSTSEALSSFTGEMGYLQTGSSFDFGKNTFFIGVRNREKALKLLRRAFIDEISTDTDLNGVTHLTLDMSKPAEGQKSNSRNTFHLAVTKDMILFATDGESLRAPLAQSASSAPADQLAPFFSSRNGGPLTLNGLSFTDFQKFDWQSLKNLPGRNKATGATVLLGLMPDKTTPAPAKSWLDEIDPKVFSRHLHLSLGYTWKDRSGLHLDGWVD